MRLFRAFARFFENFISMSHFEMKLEAIAAVGAALNDFNSTEKSFKELQAKTLKQKIFREGGRQRLLKRIKTDNVDCDGHLGRGFRGLSRSYTFSRENILSFL